MASTLALSRPSEKLGTHSTKVDIRQKNSWALATLQLHYMAKSFADRRNEARSGKGSLQADQDLRLILCTRKAIDVGRDRGVENCPTVVDE
jgi:hypothetical protein